MKETMPDRGIDDQLLAAHRQAEAALRESEAELRTLIEALPQIVWVTRPDGWHIHYNQRWMDYTGLTLEESLGHGWNPPFHPDDRPRAAKRWQQATESGEPYEIEYRLRRADGVYRWMLGRALPLRDTSGTIVKWFGTCTDIDDIKRTEEALRQSEARFFNIFEHAPIGKAVVDLNGCFLQVNQSLCDLLGYSAKELQQLSFQEITHPEDLEADLENARALLAGQTRSYSMEKRYFHKQGHVIWICLSASLIRDEQGKPLYFIGQIQDITERKRAEAALQKANDELELYVMERTAELTSANERLQAEMAERLRVEQDLHKNHKFLESVLDHTAESIVACDAAGEVTFLNRASREFRGLPPEPLPYAQWSHYYSLYQADGITPIPAENAPLLRTLRGERLRDLEIMIRPREGKTRFVIVNGEPLVDATGEKSGAVVVMHDITERKQAEMELRSSEALKTAILETALDCIVGMDHRGLITEFNPAAERVFGYARGDIIGYPLAEVIIPPALREAHYHGLKRYLETGEGPVLGQRIEVPALRADGTEIAVELAISRIPATEPPQFTAYMRDITERKRGEVERENLLASEQNAREEAERANAAKDELLSRMSHELRTPLNAILGFGQILEMEQEELSPLHQESVHQILKAGKHQLDLVNELLDLARLGDANSTLSIEPVALSEAVAEAIGMVQQLAALREISIVQALARVPPCFVLADRQRLLQVLLNLLSNAIKYNKTGGRVTVSAEVLPEGRVGVRVSDTGHGIAAEDLNKLFVPFSRLNAEQLGVQGTGLGLVLCQRMAEAMNGALQVQSELGQGSTFTLELPLVIHASPEQGECSAATPGAAPEEDRLLNRVDMAESTESSPQAQHTILLIEDKISNFKLIEMCLKDLPHVRLVGAMQGLLGVELAQQHRPDLILLDLHLPDIMGDEVLQRLQALPETRGVPVIMVSADATPAQITRLLEQGARHYLTKPLDVRQFLHVVNEIICTSAKPV